MLITLEIAIVLYLILSIVLLTFSNLGKFGRILAYSLNLIAVTSLGALLFSSDSFEFQNYIQLAGNKLSLARVLIGANLLACLQYGCRSGNNVKFGIIATVVSILGTLVIGIKNILFLFVLVEVISLLSIVFIAKSKRPSSRDIAIKQMLFNTLCSIVGFISLGLFYYATKNITLVNIQVHEMGAYQLSILFFVTYFIARLGAFPFQTWIYDYLVNVDRKNLVSVIIIDRLAIIPILFITSLSLISILPEPMITLWRAALIVVAITSTVLAAFKGLGRSGFKTKVGALMLLHSGVLIGSFTLQFETDLSREIMLYYIFTLIGLTGLLSFLNEANTTSKDDDTLYDGYYRSYPISCFKFSIYLLSLVGFPMTVGFTTRYFVLVKYFSEGQIVPVVLMISMLLLTLIFAYKMVVNVFLNIPSIHKRDKDLNHSNGIELMEWLFVILLIFGAQLATFV